MALSEIQIADLQVNALFYDALSGEFTPQCDPQGRQHTLAHLALATLGKGVEVEAPGNLSAISSNPTWAPEVAVTVDYTAELDDGPMTLKSLRLMSDRGKGLYIGHGLPGPSRQLLLTNDITRATYAYPLRLGRSLDSTRAHVTMNTKIFFDAITG